MHMMIKIVLIGAGASLIFGLGVFYANGMSVRKRKCQKYNLKKKRKGKFLIINNRTFTHPEVTERHGTDKDAEGLANLFKDIGFEILRKNDLPSEAILEAFREIACTETDDSCCFGAAILSHGGNGGVYGTDMELVRTEEIMDYFSETNCPALKEKPKMFFIQACQKSGYDAVSSNPHQTCFVDAHVCTMPFVEQKITLRPDFFLAVATPLGYLAYRSEDKGSLFIRAIVKLFREHAHEDHLSDLMTMVIEEVRSQKMQIPVSKSSLSKHLFLNPDKNLRC